MDNFGISRHQFLPECVGSSIVCCGALGLVVQHTKSSQQPDFQLLGNFLAYIDSLLFFNVADDIVQ